ncbi:MAG: hypothetical protein WA989_08160 [Henriciella sp.]|uniref:hypothetical protein n=1 Tax=Henriciella sp. TaxID=1968823 RepID=UPI003C75CFE3
MPNTSLDLAEIDPPKWRVLVSGSVYGPYTLGQLQGFVRERRIGPATRIACGDGGAFIEASEHTELARIFADDETKEPGASDEPANYLVIARLVGTGEMQLIGALNRLGKFAEVMAGVWVLRSKVKQVRIRDHIRSTVSAADQVMIANTTSGRLAWLNLGPEADIHIRGVWDADLD